jgi:hypothetical protein
MGEIFIDWWPQPRQLTCLQACGLSEPFDDLPLHPAVADCIGYGGSAGGGKTDTLLEIGHVGGLKFPKINIGYFRREFPQLEGPGGAIMRSQALYSNTAKYNQQNHRWTFKTGSILQFCHCKDPNDVYNYQSQQFDILLIDEVTQFTKEMVKYLLTRNRMSVDLNLLTDEQREIYKSFKPFACFGTNPGNVGHRYFKDEFVDIGPFERVNTFINEVGKEEKHIFIPSKLRDNQILVDRDPGYEDRVGNTEMNRKILLEGSWDVFAGQAFGELTRDVHLIDPIEIGKDWKKFGALDHGFNHPFSFGVYVVNNDGEVFRVNGIKSRLKRPDEQARLMINACEVVGGLKELEYIVAGHDCWARGRTGEPSLAEQFMKLPQTYQLPQILLRQANIDRVQGSNQMRYFIAWKNTKEDGTNGKPRFYIFNNPNGVEFYNTLAQMIFDTEGARPEDVKKVDADENGYGGDDMYDEGRYALMSRPRPALQKEVQAPRGSVIAYIQKKQEERAMREEYGY